MRNQAEIQLIGYVYQDAKCPNESLYPNWVTFKMTVNKKYKDKNGAEQQNTTWFHCKASSDKIAKNIKDTIKDKMGVLVKGYPKAKSFTNSKGEIDANIEVLVTDFNILTYPKKTEIINSNLVGNQKLFDDFNDDEIPF
jgi:hypothetical protein